MATILVVDDERALRENLSRYLTRLGYEVRVAENGKQALASLQEVDLVVTDVNMPDTDGIEVVIALSEQAPDIPVIVMSGGGLLSAELLLDSADALGAAMTLEKPFDLDELRQSVEALLGRTAGDDS